jgi:glucose-1-phosphate thymidylyltransferase
LVERSNIPPERVAAFAWIRTRDGFLDSIVEKPDARTAADMADALVSMTCWRFDERIFDACRAVRPSARGELELPEAVSIAMRRGVRFRVLPVEAGVLDISTRADIPVLERLL